MNKIDELLTEVQKLREAQTIPNRDTAFMEMESELSKARLEMNRLRKERDAMKSELEKVKSDVAWTMGKLQIRDLFRLRGSIEIPCAGEGWLPLGRDPEDTARIEWINSHGRAGIGADHWLIAIPHRLTTEEEMTELYNVRHIIDLSRATPAVCRNHSSPR